jgi:uncharacterized membrane protein HdeD (DUF308 family)
MTVIGKPKEQLARIGVDDLRMFWWAFAVRGGLAIVFAGVLGLAANLLGTLFFDPIMLVSISLLLGSYVLGNGVLLGTAGIYARQHHRRVWVVMCAESAFAIVLAGFIGFSLMMTSESLAWLAGIHALGTGCFQLGMVWKLRGNHLFVRLLGGSALISFAAAAVFLLNRQEEVRTLTIWLSGFELLFGVVVLVFALALHGGGRAVAATVDVGRADAIA